MLEQQAAASGAQRSWTSRTELHNAVIARLRGARQRYSSGRQALVEVLAEARQPITCPEIAERGATLSLSSVYRNLNVLEQAGVVRRLMTPEDTARYELTEEFTEHHHHLICDGCGAMLDYTPSVPLEEAISNALATISRTAGFTPNSHHLQVRGLCDRCRRAAP